MSSSVHADAGKSRAIDQIESENQNARAAALRRVIEHCRKFQGVDLKRSILQATLSLSLYVAIAGSMLAAAVNGLWLVVALLAPPAAGLLVKLFTIQHDCGHGSYFETQRANTLLGFSISILTFTPYGFWRDAHNRHHASSGDLDRRGVGSVDTLTVDEFRALSPAKKIMYKFYRHPLVMIVFGAPIYFLILQRLPLAGAAPFAETYQGLRVSQIWKSVAALNIALAVVYGGLSLVFGAIPVAAVFLPVVTMAAWAGSWLFFVQHQYEDAYWARKPKWNFAEAAIFGSSHYKLPQPLRWFTGNIGLHHIHHLVSRIPNYKLMECYRASEDLLSLPVLTIRESIRCARLALWCPVRERMVTFDAAC